MRLKMKVWTSPDSGDRYIVPAAFSTRESLEKEVPHMKAYAMNDDDTRIIELTADEWNALPYFFFKEDGEATKSHINWVPTPI